MDNSYFFENTTLLVTHFNRSNSLERLLKRFNELNCSFEEIIISDDCSNVEHLSKLKELQEYYKFKLITTPVNKGLANNINKGQDEVNTELTLYVQEDFVPTALFPKYLRYAVDYMGEDSKLDLIRFYSYLKYPYLKPFKNGFSEMLIKPWYLDYHKIYYYSDHPHLRRNNFLQKFGRYKEGIKGDRTEYKMCVSFIQNKGKGLFYDNYKELFIQENSEEEPSTMIRGKLTQSRNPFISVIRSIYRQLRYNFDILFAR